MHLEKITEKVPLPQGVNARLDGLTVVVSGPKGELRRSLSSKRLQIRVETGAIVLETQHATKNDKRTLQTMRAHVENMTRGVSQAHTYKLKICSGHFPMNVSIKDGILEVKNFIGEAVPRRLTLMKDVEVKMQGTEITVTSASKERAGNQASAIELLTRRPGFDNRIFQDGIYIVEKDGKEV